MPERAQAVRQEPTATTNIEHLRRAAAKCTGELARNPRIAQARFGTQERDRIVFRAIPALAERFVNGVVHTRQSWGVGRHSASLSRAGSPSVWGAVRRFQYSN